VDSREFLATILSEAKRPQIQCLSPEASFEFAVKQALEWSKIIFNERKGIWATVRYMVTPGEAEFPLT
jgi:hypothetical protein